MLEHQVTQVFSVHTLYPLSRIFTKLISSHPIMYLQTYLLLVELRTITKSWQKCLSETFARHTSNHGNITAQGIPSLFLPVKFLSFY